MTFVTIVPLFMFIFDMFVDVSCGDAFYVISALATFISRRATSLLNMAYCLEVMLLQ